MPTDIDGTMIPRMTILAWVGISVLCVVAVLLLVAAFAEERPVRPGR
jgi:putative exporter of polyketide antibiotics